MKLHRSKATSKGSTAAVSTTGSERPHGRARRVRRALAAVSLTSSIAAGGIGISSGTAVAAPCTVTGGVWAPVIIRTTNSTGPGTDSGHRLYGGQTLPSYCTVFTGGTYTACSSIGTPTNLWIPLADEWGGYWVAYRCVSGPN